MLQEEKDYKRTLTLKAGTPKLRKLRVSETQQPSRPGRRTTSTKHHSTLNPET